MTYNKPEITNVGSASRVIEGSNVAKSEIPAPFEQSSLDCELDD
jgi:hypothetical protein